MDRLFVTLGALSGCLAVAAGAFGAHALRDRLSADALGVFQTGATYQMYHALALLAVAILLGRFSVDGSAWLTASGWLFVAGTLLFSGSLYALALSGVTWLGAITPSAASPSCSAGSPSPSVALQAARALTSTPPAPPSPDRRREGDLSHPLPRSSGEGFYQGGWGLTPAAAAAFQKGGPPVARLKRDFASGEQRAAISLGRWCGCWACWSASPRRAWS